MYIHAGLQDMLLDEIAEARGIDPSALLITRINLFPNFFAVTSGDVGEVEVPTTAQGIEPSTGSRTSAGSRCT